MKSGIYKIEHLKSFKVYIGSSYNINKRIINHISCLRRNIHENRYLQKAFNKYGEKSFKFNKIETVPINKLLEKELFWINYYSSSNRKYGYNLLPIPGRTSGVKRSSEWREKQRKAHLNQKGHLHTVLFKEELSKRMKNNKFFFGQKHSIETKIKMSTARKLWHSQNKLKLMEK